MSGRHRDDNSDDDRRRNIRRRDGQGRAQAPPPEPSPLVPSDGARLTFEELRQFPAQPAPAETHLFVLGRTVPQDTLLDGLTILDQHGVRVPEHGHPDIPPLHLRNQDESQAAGAYSMIRRLRTLRHAPGWGELWSGIQFRKVAPHTYQAPVPGRFVAIKKLHKGVVDRYLQAGGSTYQPRDVRHVDDEYLRAVLQVRDRENPYREMSRMDQVGDNVHVLRQLEFLQDDHYLYIIMPHAVGRQSLDHCLFRRDQELTPKQAHGLFVQILLILAYLERHHLHHRDLSPDNFLFLEEDRLVVMDLAMSVRIPTVDVMVQNDTGTHETAKTRRTLIQAMGRFGTPAFMSPEIYHNFQVFDGVAADLWSALLILYGMLVNVPLYRRPDAQADISYRFYIVAGGITQNPTNELICEILGDVFGDETAADDTAAQQQQQHRHILLEQSTAHLGLPPTAAHLFHSCFRINPAERWTLAQVMESDYVTQGAEEDD